MKRNFIGYGATPPTFEWPGGHRLAVNIVLNYEEGAERSVLDGDDRAESVSEAVYPVPEGERELFQESIYEYGSRTAIWRVLDLVDRYAATATVFACGLALERNTDVAKAFAERQYDFAGHGYRWVAPFGLTAAQEREEIARGISSIQATTGSVVHGWFPRTPPTSRTRQLVAEAGLMYDSTALNDDLPYFASVHDRPLLVIPYSIDTNDMRFWRGTVHTADDFGTYCIDAFDWLYRESTRQPRMMTIGLHPRIIGRPGRMLALERFLEHACRYSDVWIARRADIAIFWLRSFAPPDVWNWPSAEASVGPNQ